MNNLNFRKGNQVYFLYLEKRRMNIDALGFFGRIRDLQNNSLNQTFNVTGYELIAPAYNVCFDNDLINSEQDMPSLVIPRNLELQSPKAYLQDIEKEIMVAKSLDDFFKLLNQKRLEPHPTLYGDMQKAIKKLRIKPEYI